MSHLVGSTSGLDSAIAMRERVDALELAALAVTHWHEVLELYEEARLRAVEEQQIDPASKVRLSVVHIEPGCRVCVLAVSRRWRARRLTVKSAVARLPGSNSS